MRILLFTLILNPLLYLLECNLIGIRIGHRTQKMAVVVYADDVTIFVTAPQNIIRDLLLTYKRATGAGLNIRKSKAMAVGSWDTSLNIFDIPYCPEITILGSRFMSTVAQSGSVTWSKVTGRVKTLASEVYGTEQCLNTKNPICAHPLTQRYGTQPRFFQHQRSMSNFLVHMARCNLQGAIIHFTALDRRGRSKFDRYRSQMPCPFSYQILGPRRKRWVFDCCVAECMGPAIPQDEPLTHMSNPWEYGIPTYLFS
jgi:hypothetical protein